MDLFSLLPLLEGWKYDNKKESVNVSPGESNKLEFWKETDVTGWIIDINFQGDDAYLTLKLENKEGAVIAGGAIDLFHGGGMTQPSPFGFYVTLYSRPDPNSSAGQYAMQMKSAYPFPLPVNDKVRLTVGLNSSSTQKTSNFCLLLTTVLIVDEAAFRKSLQELLGTNA